MKFEFLKIWLRWHWLPYKEETVLDVSFRWLCFEAQFKRQPTQRALDACPRCDGEGKIWQADLSSRDTCYACRGTGKRQ